MRALRIWTRKSCSRKKECVANALRGDVLDGNLIIFSVKPICRYRNPEEKTLFICGKCYEQERRNRRVAARNKQLAKQISNPIVGIDGKPALECEQLEDPSSEKTDDADLSMYLAKIDNDGTEESFLSKYLTA